MGSAPPASTGWDSQDSESSDANQALRNLLMVPSLSTPWRDDTKGEDIAFKNELVAACQQLTASDRKNLGEVIRSLQMAVALEKCAINGDEQIVPPRRIQPSPGDTGV